MVIPITDNQMEYGKLLVEKLQLLGYRTEIDTRGEKIGYKIRDAELKKIPFMFVIGKNEETEAKVTLRQHTKGDLGAMSFDEAIKAIREQQ